MIKPNNNDIAMMPRQNSLLTLHAEKTNRRLTDAKEKRMQIDEEKRLFKVFLSIKP
jgi:hypothetical protein